jgi:hypothetical protein
LQHDISFEDNPIQHSFFAPDKASSRPSLSFTIDPLDKMKEGIRWIR